MNPAHIPENCFEHIEETIKQHYHHYQRLPSDQKVHPYTFFSCRLTIEQNYENWELVATGGKSATGGMVALARR